VLFDAAHAFGCSYNGKMIGNFGCAEVFSFHATKFFNTFEGGAITTNDDNLAERIRLMKNFGFISNGDVIALGINGKMNEFSAAMGLVGLESVQHFIKVNYTNYNYYKKYLEDIPGIKLINYNENKYNYQYIVIEIDESITGINRDLLMDILKTENIITKRYFYPGCHNSVPYSEKSILLPETELLSRRVLILPTGTSVTGKDIKKICKLIKFIIKENVT
jgi:dTDP-4-amino-4,6-dideoxygalactose transaminase